MTERWWGPKVIWLEHQQFHMVKLTLMAEAKPSLSQCSPAGGLLTPGGFPAKPGPPSVAPGGLALRLIQRGVAEGRALGALTSLPLPPVGGTYFCLLAILGSGTHVQMPDHKDPQLAAKEGPGLTARPRSHFPSAWS